MPPEPNETTFAPTFNEPKGRPTRRRPRRIPKTVRTAPSLIAMGLGLLLTLVGLVSFAYIATHLIPPYPAPTAGIKSAPSVTGRPSIGLMAGILSAATGILLLAGGGWGLNRQLRMVMQVVQQETKEQEREERARLAEQERIERQVRARNAELEQENRRLQQIAQQSETNNDEVSLIRAALNSAKDVVMITDTGSGGSPLILEVNDAFERMTGYTAREAIRRSPSFLQGRDTERRAVDRLREQLREIQEQRKTEAVTATLLNYKKNGTPFWVELTIQAVYRGGQQTLWMSIQRDVTEIMRADEARRDAERENLWQANHDSLTGLPNRKWYQERLTQEIAQARESNAYVGVLFFDVDHFKNINDALGHTTGDVLLTQIADRLRQVMGGEHCVARMGGDEFTILLPRIQGVHEAQAVAQRILACVREPFVVDDGAGAEHDLAVTASIGISLAPQDGGDVQTLLRGADAALYNAKDEGRDGWRVYTPQMNDSEAERLQIRSHLPKALERNEFTLFYQPQVDLKTGMVFGVEALIRWESAQLGRVSPGKFISIAEGSGLILPIGEWTLWEACRQATQWRQDGMPLRMSVNLSVRQLRQKDFVALVRRTLQETALPPEWLDLELTEGLLTTGSELEGVLKDLKNLGVRLSVDDFGTGYSNFSYLPRLPMDVLKIDRAFISPMMGDERSLAIVRAMVEMAHAIGWEVIAEGVEESDQRALLTALHCNAMQGYLFSPPVPAEKIAPLLQRNNLLTGAKALPGL